jgi:hydroxyquinol 1,2-dioxygenase
VFGVKSSLIREFRTVDDAEEAARRGMVNPYRQMDVEVVLPPLPALPRSSAPAPLAAP